LEQGERHGREGSVDQATQRQGGGRDRDGRRDGQQADARGPAADDRDEQRPLPADRPPGPKDWSRLSAPWAARVDRAIAELQALRRSLDSCIGCGCLSMDDCDLVNPGDEAAAESEGSPWLRNVIRYR
jgi:hypothetical protein